ncbi:hypothetical protein [Histophilus somni]|uniref:hypothetical protein n=2 Tax=Histophilus somni TaxID=731 RepID=UPI00094B166E|nr:hypothetical protein [Histophilus somni]
MTQKTKTFHMRFYSTEYAMDNMTEKTLTAFLKKYRTEVQNEYITPLVKISDHYYRVKICADIENSISGYFITYRDELFTKGNMETGDEQLLEFAENEAIIEKTYFIIFYNNESEVVIFQNSRYGRVKDLTDYILKLQKRENKDGTIYLNPIGKDNFDLDKILTQKPHYVEYKIAKPRYKYRPDDDAPKWSEAQFALMDAAGAGSFKARISTKSASGLNKNKVKEIIETLIDNPNTRACKVKLEDLDEPIDLFADILKAGFTISLSPNRTSDDIKIFYSIRQLREQYASILDQFL